MYQERLWPQYGIIECLASEVKPSLVQTAGIVVNIYIVYSGSVHRLHVLNAFTDRPVTVIEKLSMFPDVFNKNILLSETKTKAHNILLLIYC